MDCKNPFCPLKLVARTQFCAARKRKSCPPSPKYHRTVLDVCIPSVLRYTHLWRALHTFLSFISALIPFSLLLRDRFQDFRPRPPRNLLLSNDYHVRSSLWSCSHGKVHDCHSACFTCFALFAFVAFYLSRVVVWLPVKDANHTNEPRIQRSRSGWFRHLTLNSKPTWKIARLSVCRKL